MKQLRPDRRERPAQTAGQAAGREGHGCGDSTCDGRSRKAPKGEFRELPIEPKLVRAHAQAPAIVTTDTPAGAKDSHLATLVERKSHFKMLVKLSGKDIGEEINKDADSRNFAA